MGDGAMAILAGRLLRSEPGLGRDTSDDEVRSELKKIGVKNKQALTKLSLLLSTNDEMLGNYSSPAFPS